MNTAGIGRRLAPELDYPLRKNPRQGPWFSLNGKLGIQGSEWG